MQIPKTLFAAMTCLMSFQAAQAATVDIGGFTFDDTAFVDSVTPFQPVDRPGDRIQGSGNLIGQNLSTFTSFAAVPGVVQELRANFDDNVAYNMAGVDLILFLPSSLNINVNIPGGTPRAFAPVGSIVSPVFTNLIGIELSDFGVAEGDFVSSLTLSAFSNTFGTSFVSAIGALHVEDPNPPAPVPLPAASGMLIGALCVLSGLRRRRPTRVG